MNVFDLKFNQNTFDYVISNGVLHHTKNPKLAFDILSKSLKNNGYILLGLYNKIGRIRTIFRKYLSKIFGKKLLDILDPTLKNLKVSNEEREAWIQDQYFHPIESLHTLDEVLSWFKKNNIDFINSIPSCDFEFSQDYEDLFEKKAVGTLYSRILNQISMVFKPFEP